MADQYRISTNADFVADEMSRRALRSDAAQVVRKHGLLLQARVKRHASLPRTAPRGRNTGGPRLMTGDYNRSIAVVFSGNATASGATVGTSKPQGRRLELGFSGTDSLGRRYNQPPYPHFGPALDETEAGFIEDLARLAE